MPDTTRCPVGDKTHLIYPALVVVIGVLGRPRGIGGWRGWGLWWGWRAWAPRTARCVRCLWRRRRDRLLRLGRTRWGGGSRGPRSPAPGGFGGGEGGPGGEEQERGGGGGWGRIWGGRAEPEAERTSMGRVAEMLLMVSGFRLREASRYARAKSIARPSVMV